MSTKKKKLFAAAVDKQWQSVRYLRIYVHICLHLNICMLSDQIFQFDVQFPYSSRMYITALLAIFVFYFILSTVTRIRIKISPTALSNSQREMSLVIFKEKYFTLFQSRRHQPLPCIWWTERFVCSRFSFSTHNCVLCSNSTCVETNNNFNHSLVLRFQY